MKILVVSSKYHPEYSGSGFRAHSTYKRLKKKYKLDFDLITNSNIYKGNKKYLFDGVEVNRISSPFKIPKKKSLLRYILICIGIFWEIFYSWRFISKKINEYHLVHTFGNTWTIGFFSWYFSKKDKPVIRELCNDISNPFYPVQIKNYMKSIFQKKNTLIIAISKKLENLAKKHDSKNIWLRPNPVDESKFFIDYENKLYLRQKLTKFNENDTLLSVIANFIENKNQLFVLDVLALLPENYKLLLVGPLKQENNDYYKLILKKIDILKLNERVDIQVGFVNNFNEYLTSSDVFLFPSKSEGLGTPLLESQTCGIPVVSNYLKDVTDTVIEYGKGGYYLDLDPKKWAEIIKKVVDIPKETKIKNARKISEISSSNVIDHKYFDIINQLIS